MTNEPAWHSVAPHAGVHVVSDAEVDEAIALCGGDARATIRALLIGQEFLEQELRQALAAASAGFARRCPPNGETS